MKYKNLFNFFLKELKWKIIKLNNNPIKKQHSEKINRTTMKIGVKFPIQLNRKKKNADQRIPLEKLKEHTVPVTTSGRTNALCKSFRKPHSLKRVWKYPRPTDWGLRRYRVESKSKKPSSEPTEATLRE